MRTQHKFEMMIMINTIYVDDLQTVWVLGFRDTTYIVSLKERFSALFADQSFRFRFFVNPLQVTFQSGLGSIKQKRPFNLHSTCFIIYHNFNFLFKKVKQVKTSSEKFL
jgi:hypothetical protein